MKIKLVLNRFSEIMIDTAWSSGRFNIKRFPVKADLTVSFSVCASLPEQSSSKKDLFIA